MQVDEKLWEVANYVTGFAIAQVVATSFAIARKEWPVLKGMLAHCLALAGTLTFTTFYITAIYWCDLVGSEHSSIPPEIWRRVTQGRTIAVLLFTVVLLVALVGHWRDDRLQRQVGNPQRAPLQ